MSPSPVSCSTFQTPIPTLFSSRASMRMLLWAAAVVAALLLDSKLGEIWQFFLFHLFIRCLIIFVCVQKHFVLPHQGRRRCVGCGRVMQQEERPLLHADWRRVGHVLFGLLWHLPSSRSHVQEGARRPAPKSAQQRAHDVPHEGSTQLYACLIMIDWLIDWWLLIYDHCNDRFRMKRLSNYSRSSRLTCTRRRLTAISVNFALSPAPWTRWRRRLQSWPPFKILASRRVCPSIKRH